MMKCPNCHHETKGNQHLCHECNNAFAFSPTETWNHLEYILSWLETHKDVLGLVQYKLLRQDVIEQQTQLEIDLGIPELQATAVETEQEIEPVAIEPDHIEEEPVPPVASAAPITVPPVVEPSKPPTVQAVPPQKPATKPKEKVKPALKRPSVDWSKVWDKVVAAAVSGALLTGLLYLGAFMIVVAAGVLAISFWDTFPPVLQLVFIALVPTTFYVFGWLTRWKLSLTQAGGVLTGIGALLVAVDFAAVYQFGDLGAKGVDLSLYWLGASIICTFIFALTAWRLPSEFFGHLTLIGMTSILIALTVLVRLPVAWIAAATALSAIFMLGIAYWLEKEPVRWPNLTRSAKRLPYLALPLSQLTVLVLPGGISSASSMTFALAAVGYGYIAWRYPATLFVQASVWSSVAAFGLGWLATDWPLEWVAIGMTCLAAFYIFTGWNLSQKLNENFVKKKETITAVYLAGFGLLILAIISGSITVAFDVWLGVIALVLCSLVLAGCAFLFRKPRLVLAAGGLFILPYTIFVAYLLTEADVAQWAAWLMLTWVGLATAYVGITVIASYLDRVIRYVAWLNLWAQLLVPMALLGLLADYLIAGRGFYVGPALLVLGAAIIFYVLSAVLHHKRHPALSPSMVHIAPNIERPIFLWPICLLIPIWLAVAWSGSIFIDNWLGVAFSGLGLVYVIGGEWISRVHRSYRLPFHVFAYGLAVVGVVIALYNTYALLFSLLLVVIMLALLSYLYRRVWETAVAGLLFLWPVWLLLISSSLSLHAYTLVYVLLAALAYVPVGIWLWRKGPKVPWRPHAFVMLVMGYCLASIAIFSSSLMSTMVVLNVDKTSWISVLVPLVGVCLAVFSLYFFRDVLITRRPFAWASVLLSVITFAYLLTLLNIPTSYLALAWVCMAMMLMLLERLLTLRLIALPSNLNWAQPLCPPLQVSTILLWLLGVSLTIPYTIRALTGTLEPHLPEIILAQTLAVTVLILVSRLYRTRWPLFLEPLLLFFPVTLLFVAFAENLLGQNLTTSQFAYVWLGLALVHLLIATWLDTRLIRYAHGLYLGGYSLLLFSLFWSIPDRVVNLVVLAFVIAVMVISQWLVYNGRHYSFNDFSHLVWRKEGTLPQRVGQASFLFVGVYAFPIWLVLLLAYLGATISWWGMSLALLAPLYIAAGLFVRRFKEVYAWPFYSAGYALTGFGAMMSFNDLQLTIVVLSLNAVVYTVSSIIFRQPFWLYLSAILVPTVTLLILYQNEAMSNHWVAGLFMAFAFVYLGLGTILNRRSEKLKTISPYALPFYGIGYVLSAVALASASVDRMLALGVYSAGVVLYLLSVWLFKESVFYYPVAWLAAVPYYLLLTLTSLPQRWLGLGWLPLIVLYVAIGHFVFSRQQPATWRSRVALTSPSLPFYILAYVLSISMMVLSQSDPLVFTLSLGAASLLYFVSAKLFQHPAWFYPALLTAHIALAAFFTMNPSDSPAQYITMPFLAMTWLVAFVGYWFSRTFPVVHKLPGGERVFSFYRWEFHFGNWPFLGYLLTPSWSQPFFLFVVLDIIVWQVVALGLMETAVFFALGIFLLLGLFAMLWRDRALPVGALAFFLLAVVIRLAAMDMAFAVLMTWLGGIGLGFYLLARIISGIIHDDSEHRLSLWVKPMKGMSIFLTGLAALLTLPLVITNPTSTAFCLAFVGVLYLAIAYNGHYRRLGYAAAAVLQLAWILLLISQEVRQPQFYAIPAGLYFVGIGILERKRGRHLFACYLEGFGFSIILLTSFIQSLNADGFFYFLLLMVESLLIIGTSAIRRVKVPFFIGLGFSVLNVVAQIIVLVNVYDINRWLVILGAGFLLISAGVYVERKRERILESADEWREALATWH